MRRYSLPPVPGETGIADKIEFYRMAAGAEQIMNKLESQGRDITGLKERHNDLMKRADEKWGPKAKTKLKSSANINFHRL